MRLLDQTHRFNGVLVYELPFGPGKALAPHNKVLAQVIGKTEPQRGAVWVMLLEFAQKYGNKFDTATMKFVDSAA